MRELLAASEHLDDMAARLDGSPPSAKARNFQQALQRRIAEMHEEGAPLNRHERRRRAALSRRSVPGRVRMDLKIEPNLDDHWASMPYSLGEVSFFAPPNEPITLGKKRVILQCQRSGEIAWVCYPVDRARMRRMTAGSPSISNIRVIVLWWHVRLWRWLRGYR